jgi:hypothetical protein
VHGEREDQETLLGRGLLVGQHLEQRDRDGKYREVPATKDQVRHLVSTLTERQVGTYVNNTFRLRWKALRKSCVVEHIRENEIL